MSAYKQHTSLHTILLHHATISFRAYFASFLSILRLLSRKRHNQSIIVLYHLLYNLNVIVLT